MSKLTNAPLNEVIFELKWKSDSNKDLSNFQILLGAMFASLKDKYPNLESIMPDPSIPLIVFHQKPTYRFRSASDRNNLFQLGPGVLTVNFVGQNYDWNVFRNDVKTVVDKFMDLIVMESNDIEVGLTYIDFFDFDFTNKNIIEYLKQYMHINFDTDLFHTRTFGFTSSDVIDGGAVFNISMNTGFKAKEEKGIVVSSKMSKSTDRNYIMSGHEDVLNSFHEKLSTFFDKMIEGDLYQKLQ